MCVHKCAMNTSVWYAWKSITKLWRLEVFSNNHSLNCSLPHFLRQCLPNRLQFNGLVSLVGQQASRTSLDCLPVLGIQMCPCNLAFHMGAREPNSCPKHETGNSSVPVPFPWPKEHYSRLFSHVVENKGIKKNIWVR